MELNLNKFSPQNLSRIRKILELILNELELGADKKLDSRFIYYELPLKVLEREGFYYEEVKRILERINVLVINEVIKKKIREKSFSEGYKVYKETLKITPDILEIDYEKNLILTPKGKTKIKKVLSLIKKREKISEPTKGCVLYLNKVGDLYREPKERHCYSMIEAKKIYEIIRYFVENEFYDYYPTKEIASDLSYDIENLRKEINRMNPKILGKLNLKKRIIEGYKGHGYRINPIYKIILRNK